MREYQRKEPEAGRPRLNLVRGDDGRLRPAAAEDITSIWADQRSIRSTEQAPGREQLKSSNNDEERARKMPGIVAAATSRRSLLKFKLPRVSAPKLSKAHRRYSLAAVAVLILVAFGVFSYKALGGGDREAAAQQPSPANNTSSTKAAATKGPQFDAVLPAGKTIEDLGGWVRVSPADKDPVFAYVDSSNGVQLNVSQQVLPENLRTSTDQAVEKLAQGFAANEKIVVDGMTAYLGTSIHGPQSVIFVKNGLLILIKSSGKLTHEQWAGYISSLQ